MKDLEDEFYSCESEYNDTAIVSETQSETQSERDATKKSDKWKALALICLIASLTLSTWFSATAALGTLKVRWELNDNQSSLLTITVQLGFATAALTAASVGVHDAVSPLRLILIGSVGAAVCNGMIVVLDSYVSALMLRFCTGGWLSLVYPPAVKHISQWFANENKGVAVGFLIGCLLYTSPSPRDRG